MLEKGQMNQIAVMVFENGSSRVLVSNCFIYINYILWLDVLQGLRLANRLLICRRDISFIRLCCFKSLYGRVCCLQLIYHALFPIWKCHSRTLCPCTISDLWISHLRDACDHEQKDGRSLLMRSSPNVDRSCPVQFFQWCSWDTWLGSNDEMAVVLLFLLLFSVQVKRSLLSVE